MLAALNELTAKGFFINSTWQPCIKLASPPRPPQTPVQHDSKQKLSGITWIDLGGLSASQNILFVPPPRAWCLNGLITQFHFVSCVSRFLTVAFQSCIKALCALEESKQGRC